MSYEPPVVRLSYWLGLYNSTLRESVYHLLVCVMCTSRSVYGVILLMLALIIIACIITIEKLGCCYIAHTSPMIPEQKQKKKITNDILIEVSDDKELILMLFFREIFYQHQFVNKCPLGWQMNRKGIFNSRKSKKRKYIEIRKYSVSLILCKKACSKQTKAAPKQAYNTFQSIQV